jgi:hypothetical protein
VPTKVNNSPEEEAKSRMVDLQSLIREAKASGEDVVAGEASELPPYPGLFVENYGHVPLPLNEHVAESLIKLSTQAPYGFKYDTLYDKEVRDTFQIDPASMKLTNPKWNPQLVKLTERVAAGLGCSGKIQANLYKMLIYKTGGHFKKHSDTEKEKNMFATLIIQLPSVHEGLNLFLCNL